MKLLFAILLCVLPVAWDLIIGTVYWKKNTTVEHVLTASVRLLIIAVLVLLNPDIEAWRSVLLAVSFHFLVFPILYNRLIMDQRFDYLGTSAWSDRLEQKIRDKITTPGVFALKLMFLMTGIKFYVDPFIY